jgi:hypothetical protein
MPSAVRVTIELMINVAKEVAPHLMRERENNYEPLAWYPCPDLLTYTNTYLDKFQMDEDMDVMLVSSSRLPMTEKNIIDITMGFLNKDPSLLGTLKHFHYTFIAKMSLMTLHQAIRQRTWDQSVESIYHAIHRGEMITPPSFRKHPEFLDEYSDQFQNMIDLYNNLVNSGVPQQEALLVIPHSLLVLDMIHINGFNAIYSIGKRTCTEAQWEIRHISMEIAHQMPVFKDVAKPQGITLGHCPERNPCGYCDMVSSKRDGE